MTVVGNKRWCFRQLRQCEKLSQIRTEFISV
jgi:hypothetical protein